MHECPTSLCPFCRATHVPTRPRAGVGHLDSICCIPDLSGELDVPGKKEKCCLDQRLVSSGHEQRILAEARNTGLPLRGIEK